MEEFLRRHLSIVMIAALALVVAAVGTAFGGADAIRAISSKTVKKIATKQVNQLAPGLSVAHSNTAGTATKADSATRADDASKVGGADVCSGVITLQDTEVRPICGAPPLFVEAGCFVEASFTEVDLHVTSETATAWFYGEGIDDAGTLTKFFEPTFSFDSQLLAQGLDSNVSPSVVKGGGGWVATGDPSGRSVNGEFSITANRTGTNQGSCLVSMGATAR